MAGRIIQLTEARRIIEPPFIDTSIRADIGDYGPPGWHLHGPLALKGRAKASILGIPGAADGDGADGDGALSGCFGGGGSILSYGAVVATGVVRVLSSALIPAPFVITHISLLSDQATANDNLVRIIVSEDTDTTQGLATPGMRVIDILSDAQVIDAVNVVRDFYPNFKVIEPFRSVKMIFRTGGATTATYDCAVDILRMQ